MRVAAVPMKQDVEHASLDHDACSPVPAQLLKFVSKPAPAMDDRRNEIIERLALNRDPFIQARDGVVPGRQRAPHGSRQPGIERVRLLLSRVDDDRR